MLPKIQYWIKSYGSGGAEDRRGAHDFIECETAESVSTLRAELYGILQDAHQEIVLDKALGLSRKHKHGSHQEWAKLMLQWMASYKG